MVNPKKRGASPPQGWRCALTVLVGRSLPPMNTLLECVDTVHQTQHCGCLHREHRLSDYLHQQDKSVFIPNNIGWWRGREQSKINRRDHIQRKRWLIKTHLRKASWGVTGWRVGLLPGRESLTDHHLLWSRTVGRQSAFPATHGQRSAA